MKKKIRAIIIMLIFAGLVVALYYKLSYKEIGGSEQVEIPETKIEEVLVKDLSSSEYPATPKAVIKLYSQMSKCFYDGGYTEKQYENLVEQYRKLLDQELLVNNPEEDHAFRLSEEIQTYGDANRFILVFYEPKEEEVKRYESAGKEYATVPMTYALKEGDSAVLNTKEEFILRKDNEGKWKILGWRVKDKGQQQKEDSTKK